MIDGIYGANLTDKPRPNHANSDWPTCSRRLKASHHLIGIDDRSRSTDSMILDVTNRLQPNQPTSEAGSILLPIYFPLLLPYTAHNLRSD
jgi:hypothetical protein